MFDTIKPFHHVALRLPSDTVKVEQIVPNTVISLGKYGSFHANSLIGRPYNLTFDILDRSEQQDGRDLRIVRAAEIHAESLLEEAEPELAEDSINGTPMEAQFDGYGLPISTEKSNINTIDDPTIQKLTFEEIEALKSDGMANPKELIAKIMANHSQLDQKTAFSLAKYTLRKQKKYMKRFTVLPLDVAALADFMMNEKDFSKVMEMRNETLGLIGSWANLHASAPTDMSGNPRSRYLVVDDTSGLLTAMVAEKMGLLHFDAPPRENPQSLPTDGTVDSLKEAGEEEARPPSENPRRQTRYDHTPATSNTITLVHPNQQPNLSLLRYFNFDSALPASPSDPSPHPLHTHLHPLTWLQLLDPDSDTTYSQEPPLKSQEELQALKPNQRSTYYRKRRRWQRTKQIVDTTRAGGFDALIVASLTNPVTICKHLVPLLAGGAQVVVYNPHVEPIMELCDVYSTARRAAYLTELRERQAHLDSKAEEVKDEENDDQVQVKMEVEAGSTEEQQQKTENVSEQADTVDSAQFPVDPTLLLTPMVHHSQARAWQVLPGRTHPLMTGKGGAEGGYVMVSTRVIPVQGIAVQARGKPGRGKKRQTALDTPDSAMTSDSAVDADRSVKRGRIDGEDNRQ